MATQFGGTWEVYGAGSVLVCKDATTDFDTIGETGGAKTHTLSIDEMPSHDHNANYGDTVDGDGTGYRFSNTNGNNASIILNKGGGQAHNNLQPYIVVYRYRRTA